MSALDDRTETYIYEKNRRFEVSEGCRCSCITYRFDPRAGTPMEHIDLVIKRARNAWEKEWGKMTTQEWQECQISITILTVQIVVEFRVDWDAPYRI